MLVCFLSHIFFIGLRLECNKIWSSLSSLYCEKQVQQFPSCWTARPTTCTWPSKLTSVYPLLASTWSTQVWEGTACLPACQFVCCQFVFMCLSTSSCCIGVHETRGTAGLTGTVWHRMNEYEGVNEWAKFFFLYIFSLFISLSDMVFPTDDVFKFSHCFKWLDLHPFLFRI